MKLTPKETAICERFGNRDEKGFVHCSECPLNLEGQPEIMEKYGEESLMCYATIDGRGARGMKLRRYY